MDVQNFDTALNNCSGVIESYDQMEVKQFYGYQKQQEEPQDVFRFKPLIIPCVIAYRSN